MSSALAYLPNFNVTATDYPNVAEVQNFSSMFSGSSSLIGTSSFSNWNTSMATNMSNMFLGAAKFNQDISSWQTANVTDMSLMFMGARSFNQPIGSWNTAKVTNMNRMFLGASAFNQNINSWETGSVTDMSWMFGQLVILTNL